jgi:hypothetical protein
MVGKSERSEQVSQDIGRRGLKKAWCGKKFNHKRTPEREHGLANYGLFIG